MRVSRAACGVRCIICEITKSVYTVVFTVHIGTFYYVYIYVYSVVTRIYILYTFVGIYETAEPARRDNNNNNNNNFCRFHGKLYSDNYNTYTPLNALKVHTYVRYSFLFVFKFFFFV